MPNCHSLNCKTVSLYIYTSVCHLFIISIQIQIRYRRKDGSKWLRVISKSRQVTADRDEHEKTSNVAITGLATVQTSARLAHNGRVQEARQML